MPGCQFESIRSEQMHTRESDMCQGLFQENKNPPLYLKSLKSARPVGRIQPRGTKRTNDRRDRSTRGASVRTGTRSCPSKWQPGPCARRESSELSRARRCRRLGPGPYQSEGARSPVLLLLMIWCTAVRIPIEITKTVQTRASFATSQTKR